MTPLPQALQSYLKAWHAQDQEQMDNVLNACPAEDRPSLLADIEQALSSQGLPRAEDQIDPSKVAAALEQLGAPDYLLEALPPAPRLESPLLAADPIALADGLILELPELKEVPRARVDRMARRLVVGSHPLVWCTDRARAAVASVLGVATQLLDDVVRSEAATAGAPIAARGASAAQTVVELEQLDTGPADILDQLFFGERQSD